MTESQECSSSHSSAEENPSLNINIDNANEQFKQRYITPMNILNLCANLSGTTSTTHVQIIINKFLMQITNASHIIIIPILVNSEEAVIQVRDNKALEEEIRFKVTVDDLKNISKNGFNFLVQDMNREFRHIIEELFAKEKNIIYFDINELNKNTRSNLPALAFPNQNHNDKSSIKSRNCSLLLNDNFTLPLINYDGKLNITFFVCIAGDESNRIYYRYCIYETLRFSIGNLLTAIELDEERRTCTKCHTLIKLSRKLLHTVDGAMKQKRELVGIKFAMQLDSLATNVFPYNFVYDSSDIMDLMQRTLIKAQEFVNAENCGIYLIDEFTRNLISKDVDADQNPTDKIRIQASTGFAGYVAENGQLLNVRNANTSEQFDENIDQPIGTKTKHLLCFPIFDQTKVIGVGQLYNKIDGYHFDKSDEQVATAFSKFTSFAIMHDLVRKSVGINQVRHKLSLELLYHHISISDAEIKHFLSILDNLGSKNSSGSTRIPELSTFTFSTRSLQRDDTITAVLQMFTDLDFINKYQIRCPKLIKFIIVVERTYRDLPYHNWMHAFTVAHFAFALLVNCKLVERGVLNELDALSLILATLCHDIDHRGVSNAFQLLTKSVIAEVYGSLGSVNERHHLSLTIYILEEENTNILDNLPEEDYKYITDTIKYLIVASDIIHHIKIFKQLVKLNNIEQCKENKQMILSLIMTCCDLCDQIKIWPVQQITADLICTEFFAQGDLQRQQGFDVPEYLDRTVAVIPQLQIKFSSGTVIPAFKLLANIFPETKYLLDNIQFAVDQWTKLV